MQATLQQPRSRLLNDSIQTALWALSIDQPARFAKPMPFSRTIDREMTDGSFMKFTWNQSDQWQQVAFTISNSFSNVYWLDASEGVISRASGNGQCVRHYVAAIRDHYFVCIKKTTQRRGINSSLLQP